MIVLVVAAHSDDEAMGCAGTLLKHVAAGDEVHLLFMTDGVGSRAIDKVEATNRQSAAESAAKIIGSLSVQNLNFPDNKMDSVPLLDVTQAIEVHIAEVQPRIIYTHHAGDLNIDHQVTHKAVLTACRPQPGFCVREIYAFEVLSSTEWQTPGLIPFIPNVYVDISEYIDIKRKVLEIYSSEMRSEPHTRTIENVIRLNQVRGNTVGVKYAECYSLIRLLN